MNVLLGEQIDVRMKAALSAFPVYTVQDKGWLGVKNGVLRADKLTIVSSDHNFPLYNELVTTIW